MVSFRLGFLLFALLLAVAGLALGLTQAFNSDPTLDERVADFQRTQTVSIRRVTQSAGRICEIRRTQVALGTPVPTDEGCNLALPTGTPIP